MKQIVTRGIILNRINYNDSDRIISVLTNEHGKVRLMAKGVRRAKSKLAGSIELFSDCEITFIEGRGRVGTLISARLITHYGNIVHDIVRTQWAYDLLKLFDKSTEDYSDDDLFELLNQSLFYLNDLKIELELIQIWLGLNFLRLTGHDPNLEIHETANRFAFNFDQMRFEGDKDGLFNPRHIKFLRLAFNYSPLHLARVKDREELVLQSLKLVQSLMQANDFKIFKVSHF